MERIIIYGAGESGQKILKELMLSPRPTEASPEYQVLAFADGNSKLWGKEVCGVRVIDPECIPKYEYDTVIIAVLMVKARNEIFERLTQTLSVPKEKINLEFIESFVKSRYRFLLDQSEIIHRNNVQGSVAEVGVWRGDYAKYINAYFPDRDLYLFDTFSWYDERDVKADSEKGIVGSLLSDKNIFRDTSVEYVQSILPHPEKAIFKVGYFPESAVDVDCKFAFVNLDVNLYSATLAALEFFYPKMEKGGVILCHDFFSWDVDPGSSMAIDEFCKNHGFVYMAIGDRLSVAFLKQ